MSSIGNGNGNGMKLKYLLRMSVAILLMTSFQTTVVVWEQYLQRLRIRTQAVVAEQFRELANRRLAEREAREADITSTLNEINQRLIRLETSR